MLTEKDISFLSQKLQDLETALFLNQSEAVLKIPAAIIHLIKVDEAAQMWFFIPRPKQNLSEFERAFLSDVQFYQKGKNYFIRVTGKAHIVSDPEEINGLVEMNEEIKKMALTSKVLVKVNIEKFNHYEMKRRSPQPVLSKLQVHFQHLVFNQRRRIKSLQLQPESVAY
jgi:hypothetical protein